MTENIGSCYDAEQAEIVACVEFARDFGITHFILGGDAQNVVNKINSNQLDLSMTGQLITGIREMIQHFPEVQYVSRKFNRPAHEAARLANDRK